MILFVRRLGVLMSLAAFFVLLAAQQPGQRIEAGRGEYVTPGTSGRPHQVAGVQAPGR